MNEKQKWLDQVQEEILEPDRPIVDPHHHLWKEDQRRSQYLLEDLWADTGSGHNVEKTVFIECNSSYRTDGPENFRPLGETEFVASVAGESAAGPDGSAQISAIIGHANLNLGAEVEEVLQAQLEVGKGLFRGIRHQVSWDASEIVGNSRISPPPHQYYDPTYRDGFSRLSGLNLSFEAWLFHPQISELTELARTFPDTTIILNHFGGPIGIGPYENHRREVFEKWKQDIETLSQCSNVVAKLGGLAMTLNGFGWDQRDKPASSDELVEAQRAFYLHAIDQFGPDRCMFESNFPVDKASISYPVYWNAFKKIAAGFSEDEKEMLFRGTATRVYKL